MEDVVYENSNGDNSISTVSDAKIFRRLTFERSSGLVQSEALLRKESFQMDPSEAEKKRSLISSKSRKKGGKKRSDSCNSPHGTLPVLSHYLFITTLMVWSVHKTLKPFEGKLLPPIKMVRSFNKP